MLLTEKYYSHLMNKIVACLVVDKKMMLTINIDSMFHKYLNEHLFGETFFVPATFIVELMFEVCYCYCESILKKDGDKLKPLNMKGLDIMRGLKRLPGGNLDTTFEVELKKEDKGELYLEVKITSERINKAGDTVGVLVNAESEVVLTENQIEVPKFQPETINLIKYGFSKEIMYHTFFPRLGYHFQTCLGGIEMDREKNHLFAIYNCENKEISCITGIASDFITSPLGNDACLQYAVLLSRLTNGIGRLPISAADIQFYRKSSVEGNVCVYIEKLYIDEEDTEYNITCFDQEGVFVRFNKLTAHKSPYQEYLTEDMRQGFLNKYAFSPSGDMTVCKAGAWQNKCSTDRDYGVLSLS